MDLDTIKMIIDSTNANVNPIITIEVDNKIYGLEQNDFVIDENGDITFKSFIVKQTLEDIAKEIMELEDMPKGDGFNEAVILVAQDLYKLNKYESEYVLEYIENYLL